MNLKRKIISLALCLFVIAAIGVFAKGQGDNFTKKEAVTLTGAITINNRMFPELAVSDKTYLLLVPRFLVFKLDIKDGDQITVAGNVVEPKDNTGPQLKNLNGIKVLVEKATINGKEYNLKDYAHKWPRGGMRGGMMRGPGYGRDGGHPDFGDDK